MKIIEIRTTPSGREVAYLFDERRGRVVKMLVDDFTGEVDPEPDYPQVDMPARIPRVKQPRPDMPIDNMDEDDDDVVNRPPMGRPAKRHTIIPPGLTGVFKPPGSAGAAEEIRTI